MILVPGNTLPWVSVYQAMYAVCRCCTSEPVVQVFEKLRDGLICSQVNQLFLLPVKLFQRLGLC